MRLAVRAAEPVRVAALEWLDPVFVAGHWTPQLIEYAGGFDVLGMAGEHSEQRDWDEVRAAQPEVVVVMPCGYDAERALEEAETYADELASLGARRVVAVDAAAYFSRPGPRLIDGLELLGHILHPDRLPDAPGAGPRSGPLVRRDSRLAGRRVSPCRLTAIAADDGHGADGTQASTGSRSPRRLAPSHSIASAAIAPPIRPPMWPPIEMFRFGNRNGSARLKRITGPRPDRHGSIPRARWKTNAAAIRPNTAPDAPTVSACGVGDQRAERAGEQRREVERHEAHVPEHRLEHRAEPVQDVHVEGDVQRVAGSCRNAPVTSRQYSPSATPISSPS